MEALSVFINVRNKEMALFLSWKHGAKLGKAKRKVLSGLLPYVSSSDPTARNPLFQTTRQGVTRDFLGTIHQFFGLWTRHWDLRTYSSTTF
jgi:hypothetical protein